MTHLDYDGRQWVLLSDYNALAARLAEAEALLRKCRGEIEAQDGYLEQLCPRTDGFGGPHPAVRDIDAFLAPDSASGGCVVIGDGYCTTHKQPALMCLCGADQPEASK